MRLRRRPISVGQAGARARILFVSVTLGLVAGSLMLLAPLEDVMKIGRNRLRSHNASGQIVMVAVDDRSLAEVGAQPWSRARYAAILRRLHDAGARSITLNLDLANASDYDGDRALEAALRAAGPQVWLTSHRSIDTISGARTDSVPLPRFARHAHIVNDNVWVERNTVWSSLYGVSGGGRSIASELGGVRTPPEGRFPIDYAIDVRSVPLVSASDVLRGKTDPRHFAGRDVIIGQTASMVEHVFAPGYGAIPIVFFHVLGAETLRSGVPTEIGWLPPLLAALLLGVAFLWVGNRYLARGLLGLGFAGTIIGPLLLDQLHVFALYAPALLLLCSVAVGRLATRMKHAFHTRGTTNPVSGLPNLNALRQMALSPDQAVLAARIQNFPEITTALPPDSEKELVQQIARRIGFAAKPDLIFQGDDGIFVWVAADDGEDTLAEQLDGLHALFRSPLVVAGRLIDLGLAFGLDTDRRRSIVQRVSSALVAADTAAREGRRWMAYDPSDLEDAEWRMSLLARLDQAIDGSELWVAYQPKLDLASGQILGAEALARWTHPEKGEISPVQFIAAAERSGRIERLTAYILDEAVARAAEQNRRGAGPFAVAVNLSARLLAGDAIVELVDATLIRHGLAPWLLTLEVTETAAITDHLTSVATLEHLSALGVKLSIDDYGTGFSTLEYLRSIPASEIKIDRSFVAMLDKSQSDRIMVNSTIQLAHSLGRTVVAEGVETLAVLNELRRMNCDIAQGYYTGRPMKWSDLCARLSEVPEQEAA